MYLFIKSFSCYSDILFMLVRLVRESRTYSAFGRATDGRGLTDGWQRRAHRALSSGVSAVGGGCQRRRCSASSPSVATTPAAPACGTSGRASENSRCTVALPPDCSRRKQEPQNVEPHGQTRSSSPSVHTTSQAVVCLAQMASVVIST